MFHDLGLHSVVTEDNHSLLTDISSNCIQFFTVLQNRSVMIFRWVFCTVRFQPVD